MIDHSWIYIGSPLRESLTAPFAHEMLRPPAVFLKLVDTGRLLHKVASGLTEPHVLHRKSSLRPCQALSNDAN